MSNCVNIHTDIAVDPANMDYERLAKDIAMHEPAHYTPGMSGRDAAFYWFINSDTVYMDDGMIILSLGNGRSGHTWRDLKFTAQILAEYLTIDQPLMCPMTVSDESDGFQLEYRYELELKR